MATRADDTPGLAAERHQEQKPIADRGELLILLTKAARKGNVPAMRILLEELKADAVPIAPRSAIDELAAKRRTS